MSSPDRLSTPGRERNWLPKPRVDSDTFGRVAEAIASFVGSASFLFWMSVFIVVWVVLNTILMVVGRWDPYPFMLLTLILSVQASYAAPLILLAQNRQEARDRVSLEHDREVAAQSRADMDFLAREIASLRLRVNDLATRDFIRSELRELLQELSEGEDDGEAQPTPH
ncbi:MAG: DUF1003 domain-containing protein [Propionibacteriaceae bacterium]|jgi:uncharacterized membrane protein|nr:DUF1003 domain-containing protein [Propionibacteriaceae bacterium]